MSRKHSTPPPPPQRACPERPSKANLPISFCCFPEQLFAFVFCFFFFLRPVFCQKKTKNPTSPSIPSLQPNLFLLLLEKKNNPNKNPHITHNPILQTANLDPTAEEQPTGREGNGSAKDPRVCQHRG